MFKYELLNKPNLNTSKRIIDNIFNIMSKTINNIQKGTINIVFLDDNSIKKLNKKYRQIDKTTDVLSFHYYEEFANLKDEQIVGEIIMSENKITKQAKEYSLGKEKEFYKLLIHSLLHILGYDHEEKNDYLIMQKIEDKIWKEVFDK